MKLCIAKEIVTFSNLEGERNMRGSMETKITRVERNRKSDYAVR